MNIIRLACKSRMLNLDQIRCDCGTQIRQSVNEDTVTEYAEAMRNGADFPEAIVFWDEYKYILADGFHRHLARARAGFKDIKVEVWLGTRAEAIRWALGANAKHGLRRNNADKRHAVEVALTEWPKLSDRQIADLCAVSHTFIAGIRSEISTGNGCQLNEPRIGADGRERRVPQNQGPSASAPGAPASGRPANPNLTSDVIQHLESSKSKADELIGKFRAGAAAPELKDSYTALRAAFNKVGTLFKEVLSLQPEK